MAGVLLVTRQGLMGKAFAAFASWLVGLASFPFLFLLLVFGLRLILERRLGKRQRLAIVFLAWLLPVWASLLMPPAHLRPGGGGVIGDGLWHGLTHLFGTDGGTGVVVASTLVAASLWIRNLPRRLLAFVAGVPGRLHDLAAWLDRFLYEEVAEEGDGEGEGEVPVDSAAVHPSTSTGVSEEAVPTAPSPEDGQQEPPLAQDVPGQGRPKEAAANSRARRPTRPLPTTGRFRLPPLDLLRPKTTSRRGAREASDKARLLEETLASFGVHVRVLETVEGPVVTRFEVQPAPGVKVSRIVSLADDIALAMAATDVRIEAPIPGKSAVGIEIPNREATPVLLRDVIDSEAFQHSPSHLTVALGKDIAGRPVVAQLERMPHLLIAGATGSGKSVCLNSIILSLLFRNTPDDLRLLLIDPKVVELQAFDGIPHLLAPLVTDAKKAAQALRRMVREMESRYRLFAEAGVRDLERYNELAGVHLPKVVIVIDELADLMMVAPVEVEDAICRLAQMARAAGMHLVVATQRPSVDVITGLIKANIPSRIAFAVSSQVDSRTILDHAGAEKLLGKGDMLFAPLGRAKPVRAQGAYVDDAEVDAVTDFWRAQAEPSYPVGEEWPPESEEEDAGVEQAELDHLFKDAVRVVVEARQASASLLQRRLRVGYARAARLVEQMEARGIVGPADGSRPREVRITASDFARLFGNEEHVGS